jgi:hypothetical protein
MTTDELQNYLAGIKTVYVQSGFNRFPIADVWEYNDYILITLEEDAENPTVFTNPPDNVA